MDIPEKLVTQGPQDEDKKNKYTTQYALDTTIRKQNTNNVNKTWALLHTTGGKDRNCNGHHNMNSKHKDT